MRKGHQENIQHTIFINESTNLDFLLKVIQIFVFLFKFSQTKMAPKYRFALGASFFPLTCHKPSFPLEEVPPKGKWLTILLVVGELGLDFISCSIALIF